MSVPAAVVVIPVPPAIVNVFPSVIVWGIPLLPARVKLRITPSSTLLKQLPPSIQISFPVVTFILPLTSSFSDTGVMPIPTLPNEPPST